MKTKQEGVFAIKSMASEIASRMETAFILIRTQLGNEEGVAESLRKIDGVDEAYVVFGEYDVIARVHALTREGIDSLVANRVQKIEGLKNLYVSLIIDINQPYL